jgi:leucyl-tRNA synthetase
MAADEKTPEKFFSSFESKWQDLWEKNGVFRAANPGEPGSEKPKCYVLDMFPYPSGDGLHVGHPLGYISSDIYSRYKRMKGFNVLHPMGWDAFGLPAEQYAIKTGIHPSVTTAKNIQTFKRQLKMIGLGYDWSREVNTSDPGYYKWTQWIFKKLLDKGLAYQAEVLVNWCPALGTVLANDEVIDGKSERGGHPVERRPMRQWMLKITDYAERLLKDLDTVDWPESTKEHQRNWIGRSEGAQVRFKLAPSAAEAAAKAGLSADLEIFTTRPDTLFGVTFMVVAPEHPLVKSLAKAASPSQQLALDEYVKEASRKNDLQRTDLAKSKTGVATGFHALHPITGKEIPIWVADYVLMNYGTGAIMAVPAHDERDGEFARTFGLPVIEVVAEDGRLVNSSDFNTLEAKVGATKIIERLEQTGVGEKKVTYRLRDWTFARQRYWGEPIPVIRVLDGKDAGQVRALRDEELPLTLPSVEKYEPSGTGESPLSTVADWVNVKDPVTGAKAVRETNTMPGSAGSSWYFLRYMDARNDQAAWSKSAENYWQQVDFYLGGSEHAVGHLLYSRFWQKVLFDLGLVSASEPFRKLVHQGMILAEDGEKMSKSRGNVVNPDKVIEQYGADTFRLFEMFLGPLEKAKPWNTSSIEGVHRFVSRYWRLATETPEGGAPRISAKVQDLAESEWPAPLRQAFHKTIRQVGEDIEGLRFNTAVSALMILLNEAYELANSRNVVPKSFIETFAKILAPFAPHIAEEVWHLMGYRDSVTLAAWPAFDPSQTESSEIEIGVQINGKLRDTVKVAKDTTEEELKKHVLAREAVVKWMEGKTLKKFIYVKGKIVSVVI